jgi:hypothetical protein
MVVKRLNRNDVNTRMYYRMRYGENTTYRNVR